MIIRMSTLHKELRKRALDNWRNDRLVGELRNFGYKEGGPFKLASGRESPYYIDVRALAAHAYGRELIGKVGATALAAANLHLGVQGIVGPELGGIVPACYIADYIRGLYRFEWVSIFKRKAPKDHGTGNLFVGDGLLPEPRNVIVVEDVTTTGQTAIDTVCACREAQMRVKAVVTVVDREEDEAAKKFELLGIPFLALTTLAKIRDFRPPADPKYARSCGHN